MMKVFVVVIIGVALGIVTNLVSNYFSPAATKNRRLVIWLLIFLTVLSAILAFPESASSTLNQVVLENARRLFNGPWSLLYFALIGLACLVIFRYAFDWLRYIFSSVPAVDEDELTYLNSLIADLERRNQLNRWSDKLYIEVDSELREQPSFYDVPPSFYLARSINKHFNLQEYNNLSNVEKIDSSRGMTFKSLESAWKEANDNTVVVIGPPGSGKTVSLRNLAIKLALRRISSQSNKIPVFINLGYYIGETDSKDPENFEDFLEKYFSTNGYLRFLANRKWEELLKKGRCIFFLDGLDELPRSAGEYQARAKNIELFARAWPATKFILSCRELDYERSLLFQQVLIKPFDRSHIRSFISKYFTGELRRTILGQLEEVAGIFELCRNPFYLNLVCYFVKNEGYLPQNKSQLFISIVDYFIDRESGKAGVQDKAQFRLELMETLTSLASYLAFTKKTTTVSLAEYIDSYSNSDVHLKMIQYAIKGELIEFNSQANTIRFTHNRFQEFFSSFFISANFREDSSVFPPGFFSNLWWRETSLFVAGTDLKPSDFVKLIYQERADFQHPEPIIERMLKLDLAILAFECVFSSLNFDDAGLREQIRKDLIHYYDNVANTLEKAKILSALALDASEEAQDCVERALDDESDWVSERAFFITTEGVLKLRMKPWQVLKEFWRLFINGRIIWTLIPVLKASSRARLVRLLLPIYFLLLLANLICIALIGYVFATIIRFVAFQLEIDFSTECFRCLTSIAFAITYLLGGLTQSKYPWMKRFIFTTPIAIIALYLVFNLPDSTIAKGLGTGCSYLLLEAYNHYTGRQKRSGYLEILTVIILGLFVSTLLHRSFVQGKSESLFSFVERFLDFPIFPSYISNIGTAILITALFARIVLILLAEITTLRKLFWYRNNLRNLVKLEEGKVALIDSLKGIFDTLQRHSWAQKILLEDVINMLSDDPQFNREKKISFLHNLGECTEPSPHRDSIFQRIEDEEKSYRREIAFERGGYTGT